eukprot:8179323-Pyramimonas_sp.AAC.1
MGGGSSKNLRQGSVQADLGKAHEELSALKVEHGKSQQHTVSVQEQNNALQLGPRSGVQRRQVAGRVWQRGQKRAHLGRGEWGVLRHA